MSLLITSAQNPRIKSLLALSKSRERAERGVFSLEGAREISRALNCGYEVRELYWCEEVLSEVARNILKLLPAIVQKVQVSAGVFAKIALREGSDGLVAVLTQKEHGLASLEALKPTLLLAVQGVEKPGNLGALLRSADGAGIDGILLLDQTLDLYNPLVLRASVGTAFKMPVATVTSQQLRDLAKQHEWQIIAAALSPKTIAYTAANYAKPTVILLGTEADGLTSDWLSAADFLVQIPMNGIADSLNVSVAGAIIMYEARRQRELVIGAK